MLTTSNEARARPTPCRRFESRNDGIGLKNATTPHQNPTNPIAKIKLPIVAPQPGCLYRIAPAALTLH
jgi:hypothetical protein